MAKPLSSSCEVKGKHHDASARYCPLLPPSQIHRLALVGPSVALTRTESLSGDGDTRNSHFSWHITRSVGAGLSQSLDHTTNNVRNWYRTLVRDYSSGLCRVEALIHVGAPGCFISKQLAHRIGYTSLPVSWRTEEHKAYNRVANQGCIRRDVKKSKRSVLRKGTPWHSNSILIS